MYSFFLCLLVVVFHLPTIIQCDDVTYYSDSYERPKFNQQQQQQQQQQQSDENVKFTTTTTDTEHAVEKVVISNLVEEVGKSYLGAYLNLDVYVVKVLIFETISPSLAETIRRVLVKYELSRLYDYTAEVRCLLLVHKKGMETDIDLFTIYSGDEQLLIINGRKSVVGEAISAILQYRATTTTGKRQ